MQKKKDAKSNNNGANGLALVEYAFAILGRKRGGWIQGKCQQHNLDDDHDRRSWWAEIFEDHHYSLGRTELMLICQRKWSLKGHPDF